jgi:hypothetical protein
MVQPSPGSAAPCRVGFDSGMGRCGERNGGMDEPAACLPGSLSRAASTTPALPRTRPHAHAHLRLDRNKSTGNGVGPVRGAKKRIGMVIGSESGPDIIPHLPVTQPDVRIESRAKVEVLQGTSSLPAECRRRGLALLLRRYISPLIIDVLAPQGLVLREQGG